jgi:hypothetical protein
VVTYPYHDAQGRLLYEVCRFEPKTFRQRRPDGQGGYTWGLGDVERVVYGLPQLVGQASAWWVEGEKDADRLRANGLTATTAMGGAEAWRPEYARQLADAGIRSLTLLPDNDPPGHRYAETVARAVADHGIAVRVLALPGLPPKGDVSDWLDAGGTVDALECLAAAAAPLDESGVRVEALGTAYRVTAGGLAPATLEYAAFHEAGGALSAEITATVPTSSRQHWSRLNLAAPRSRADLAKVLTTVLPGPLWGPLLDEACQRVALAMRAGVAPVELRAAPPNPAKWLIPRLVPRNETTVLYGDGGTLKSLLALALAWSALGGRLLAPDWPVPSLRAVIYADWESRREEHEERWWGLSRGVGIEGPGALHYVPMHRPIAESIGQLQRVQKDTGAELVILDSLAPACGAEPEGSDAAVQAMTAIRSLPCTRLVVAHVSKAAAESNGPAKPFGSVFVANLARSTILARLSESVADEAPAEVTYMLTKANQGRKGFTTALAWLFTESGMIGVDSIKSDASFGTLSQRILAQLEHGSKSVAELAEETDSTVPVVRQALARMAKRSIVVRLDDFRAGRGAKAQWGRVDEKRSNG